MRFAPHSWYHLTVGELRLWRVAHAGWFGGALVVLVATGFLLVTEVNVWSWVIVAAGWTSALSVVTQGEIIRRARRRFLVQLEQRHAESEARYRRFTSERDDRTRRDDRVDDQRDP